MGHANPQRMGNNFHSMKYYCDNQVTYFNLSGLDLDVNKRFKKTSGIPLELFFRKDWDLSPPAPAPEPVLISAILSSLFLLKFLHSSASFHMTFLSWQLSPWLQYTIQCHGIIEKNNQTLFFSQFVTILKKPLKEFSFPFCISSFCLCVAKCPMFACWWSWWYFWACCPQ